MTDILILAVLSTLIGVLIPESKGDSMRRSITLIAGLCVLLAIAQPLVRTADHIRSVPERLYELLFPEWAEGEEIHREAEEWTVRRGVRNAENGIAALLSARWQIGEDKIAVNLQINRNENGDIVLECVEIILDTDVPVPDSEISTYITDFLACPCRIIRGKEREE